MPDNPPAPFFVIAGPTASGKSELAVRVAERCSGEIVGADAFQIYHGLDILTAKPGLELRRRIPHHLVGEVPLTEGFDVSRFISLAHQRIAEIRARGKTAIVCGGTGLYVRALIRGLADLPGGDRELRAQLESRPSAELRRQLAELDPAAASRIDLQNPRRVIRALEVCLLTGRPCSTFRDQWSRQAPVRGILLLWDRAELHRRIAERTAAMFTSGVEEEVRAISEIGETAQQAIGFREIRDLLRGRTTREECVHAIAQATRRYAKRQLTWFRREPALAAVDLSSQQDVETLSDELARRAASAAEGG